jgi:hypothetical protein
MTDAQLLEQVQILEKGLVTFATGGGFGDASYEDLRKLLITDSRSKKIAPGFLKTNRTLEQFWQFIKGSFAHYGERREYIWTEFTPLHDELEDKKRAPADIEVSEILMKFDGENVHEVWQKALVRREGDSEGAITSARTLLETVCKHILDQSGVEYPEMQIFRSCIGWLRPSSIWRPISIPKRFLSRFLVAARPWWRA